MPRTMEHITARLWSKHMASKDKNGG